MFPVELTFCGDLPRFLRRALRGASPVRRELGEKTAVKDVIEACGVPHVEVDLIVATDPADSTSRAIDFTFPVQSALSLTLYPTTAPPGLLPSAPRLQPRAGERFVADGHLGALARQ